MESTLDKWMTTVIKMSSVLIVLLIVVTLVLFKQVDVTLSVTSFEKDFTCSYPFMLFIHYIFSIIENKDTSLFQFLS